MFHGNTGELIPEYMVLQPRDGTLHSHQCKNLKIQHDQFCHIPPLKKPTLASSPQRGATSEKANKAIGAPSQAARYYAEGCMALGWKLANVINDPLSTEPAVEVSARGRDEPVVRYQHAVTSRTSLLRASSSDTPLQGVCNSGKPAEGDRFYLAKTKLSGCSRQKLKKASASLGNGDTQQPGHA
jgi:hypothetical protein